MMNFIISFSNTRQFNLKQENQEFYSQIIIKHGEDYCFSMTFGDMIFYYFFKCRKSSLYKCNDTRYY